MSPVPGAIPRAGALAAEHLAELIRSGAIRSSGHEGRLQPCSLDLTLSGECWRLPGSILPLSGESVEDLVREQGRELLDLSTPRVLERGQVYVVRLEESLDLPPWLGAYTNNKSSIGRMDVQTRTLTDGNPRYDKVPRGYRGPLWAEVTPRSFAVELQAGCSLNQAIFYGRREVLSTTGMEELMQREALVLDADGNALDGASVPIDDGILLSADLEQEIPGFVAKATHAVASLIPGQQRPGSDFFDLLPRPERGRLLLRRGQFHILSTRERIRIPPDHAVEMLPYETSAGEFRAHYAGFFDPGFGWSPEGSGRGTPAVLELRPYDDDVILRHGQPICRMAFERMAAVPLKPYGASGSGSHYNEQRGPRLSRYFL
jgi:dCTP deaminase